MMSLVPWEFTVRVFLLTGFTPDSRSNSIALDHTRSDRFPHSFIADIVHGITPSHSIPIPTDRPFKARVLVPQPASVLGLEPPNSNRLWR